MTNCFIINSSAGKRDSRHALAENLRKASGDFKIYRTKGPLDATRFIRTYCTNHPDEKIRFYACGGDGTLNEVINGVVGFENAEAACYPSGSGNDYVKYYGGKERFLDIDKLIEAPAVPVDLINVNGFYSVNVVNAGLDAYACKTMGEVKKVPVIGGKNAYYFGVAKSFVAAMKTKAFVYADGELLNESGEFLLCTAANGKYYGGSFCCAPYSVNDDGLMEVCLVKPISRSRFLSLVKSYEEGKHLEDPKFKDILVYRRCKKLEIIAEEDIALTIDGELVINKKFTCEIVPKAIKFAVPEE